jgi:hypothetical protein
MAIEKSKVLIDKAFANSIYLPNIKNIFIRKLFKFILIRLFYYIRKFRYILTLYIFHPVLFFIYCYLRAKPNSKKNNLELKTKSFLSYSKDYIYKDYVFLENFLDTSYHKLLSENFPSKMFFKHKNDPTKFYYWGFEYLNGRYLNHDKKLIDCFTYLKSYYEYILSEEFKKNLTLLFDDRNFSYDYSVISINCTFAEYRSFLIPHKDTAFLDSDESVVHNFIHFIDGNDKILRNSGATSLYLDNEFKKEVLVPSSLKNSLLIYNTKANLFHGFNFMEKKSFRKAIAFQILKKKNKKVHNISTL